MNFNFIYATYPVPDNVALVSTSLFFLHTSFTDLARLLLFLFTLAGILYRPIITLNSLFTRLHFTRTQPTTADNDALTRCVLYNSQITHTQIKGVAQNPGHPRLRNSF